LILFLSVILLVLVIALGFSVYMNYKLSRHVLNLEDRVEESLDILDEVYERMAYIASTPLMSDEPLVRDMINAIKGARDSILLIANKLFAFGQNSSQEPDDDTNT
jgi:hypothetical protein